LSTDVFANYVLQKILEFASHNEQRQFINVIKGNIFTLSLQQYSCRVLQKFIEVSQNDIRQEICNDLQGHVIQCVKDQVS